MCVARVNVYFIFICIRVCVFLVVCLVARSREHSHRTNGLIVLLLRSLYPSNFRPFSAIPRGLPCEFVNRSEARPDSLVNRFNLILQLPFYFLFTLFIYVTLRDNSALVCSLRDNKASSRIKEIGDATDNEPVRGLVLGVW